MAINGSVTIIAGVNETLDTPENHTGSIATALSSTYTFVDGVAAGQNDIVWSDRRTVGAGATDNIDLAGGGLLDVFGNAIAFVEVTAIVIRNRETVAGTRRITFGAAVAAGFAWLFNAAADRISINPGSSYVGWEDNGVAVVAGVTDVIAIVNTDGANTVTYDIIIVGRTV
jgi:hypothetical protein